LYLAPRPTSYDDPGLTKASVRHIPAGTAAHNGVHDSSVPSAATRRAAESQPTDYFTAHGVSDPAAAHHQAIIALGNLVKRQALVLGFSDTFAVLGVVLLLAGAAINRRREQPQAAGTKNGNRVFRGVALAGRARPPIAENSGAGARDPDRPLLPSIAGFRGDALRHSRTGQNR